MPKFPTAILATGLVLLAALSVMTGLILDTVARGRREARRLRYLALQGPIARSGSRAATNASRIESDNMPANGEALVQEGSTSAAATPC